MLDLLRVLTPGQRSAVLASYLGCMLDAFDFFILVLSWTDIAEEFGTRGDGGHFRDFPHSWRHARGHAPP